MKPYILLIAGMLSSFAGMAQTEVKKYQAGITEEGITYFLPQTQVRVVVHATKTHYIPGEFCEYAKRYLRLNNVPQSSYDKWEIEDIELYSYGVADKTKAYTIKMNSKTSAPLVSLTPDGRLVAINKRTDTDSQDLPEANVVRFESKKRSGNDFKTEEILSAGSKAKMAELTANEIYNIRENRSLLTKGQADFMPKDGAQLNLMLNSLDEQEQGLLLLFKGDTTTEKHTFTFDLAPNGEAEKVPLFCFSKYLGMVDLDDPAGSVFYYSIKDTHALPHTEGIENNSKKEIKDLRYVIPGRAHVKVFNQTQDWAEQNIPMAQFGRIEHLGGDLFNKKYTTRITLSPSTGGIEHVEAEKPE